MTRIPDQSLVIEGQAEGIGRVQATRDGQPDQNDATYAKIYVPDARQVTINTQRIADEKILAYWLDPCSGKIQDMGVIKNQPSITFETPDRPSGSDWVLLLDAASANYLKP